MYVFCAEITVPIRYFYFKFQSRTRHYRHDVIHHLTGIGQRDAVPVNSILVMNVRRAVIGFPAAGQLILRSDLVVVLMRAVVCSSLYNSIGRIFAGTKCKYIRTTRNRPGDGLRVFV
jgi:hypothetical protein